MDDTLAVGRRAYRYAWQGTGDGWGVASPTLIPTLCCRYSMQKKKNRVPQPLPPPPPPTTQPLYRTAAVMGGGGVEEHASP